MYRYTPLNLDLLLNVSFYQWLQVCKVGQSLVGLCHGQGSPLLAGPLSYSPLCHNGLAPSRSGLEYLCHSMPTEEIHDMANEGLSVSSPSIVSK